MKNLTIRDIARLAGVSIATVSRVLNKFPRIKPATKERILKVIGEKGYRPNPLARGLSAGRTNNVGFVLIDISNPFYSPIIRAIENRVEREGYHLFLCNTEHSSQKESRYINTLVENKISGLIISPLQRKWDYLKLLKARKIPFVLICASARDKCDCIDVDNVDGAYNAVNHLINLGHKKIAYIGRGLLHAHPASQRLRGYKKALADSGIPFNENLVVSTITDQGKIEEGYQTTSKLIALKEKPTAIFAFNDLIAIGCMKALKENGVRVPEDMAVVGFDDIEIAPFLEIPLTTVRIPQYEIGKTAAMILFEKINGSNEEKCRRICFKPELIIRGSCGSRMITGEGKNE